ncbi:MAG: N-acetylmuramoyl-L-alanine amidase, partial [Thermodesulfobacteriota bacterium]
VNTVLGYYRSLKGTPKVEVIASDQEPERPPRREVPEVEFIYAACDMVAKGARPEGLEGLIVHYTAGRRYGSNGEDAQATVSYCSAQGLYLLSIGRFGHVVLPCNHDWNKWGYHAGPSKCPVTGRTGVSRYYAGVEITNPGLLEDGRDGWLYPWYNREHSNNGDACLKEKCRWSDGQDNIHRGWYLPYTKEQEEALVNLCLFLAKSYPSFSLDKVFGHDEVSPGRKFDPGAALSLTMPEFRAYLKRLS